MDLSVLIMEKEKTIQETLLFQTDNQTLFWKEQLFKVYPELDKEKGLYNSWKKRKEYLSEQLSYIYDKEQDKFNQQVEIYTQQWVQYKNKLTMIFSEIFNLNSQPLFNNMKAYISLNPICPRYLKKQSYSLFYKFGPKQFLNMSIHEITHFVWFYVWQNYFNDNKQEYETPHLKWLLSEMVIDTLIKNTKLNTLYAQEDLDKPAYEYFYNIKIQNTPLLDTLKEIYLNSPNIQTFMKNSYRYLQINETTIRNQIP